MILEIKRGENVLYTVPIMSADTTPMPVPIVANLYSLSVEIKQRNKVLATYVLLADGAAVDPLQPEITVGSQTHYCNVEIVESLSELFLSGPVFIKVYMRKTDSTFIVGLRLRDIDEFQILNVTL